MNKSEESQSTSCTPIPFNTRYEGPTVDQGKSCVLYCAPYFYMYT